MNNSCVCGTADALMYDGSYKKIQDLKKNDTIYGVYKDGCYTKFTNSGGKDAIPLGWHMRAANVKNK